MATTNKEFRTKNGIVSGDTISATGLAGALLSSTNPVALGSAGPGTSTIPSRQDHVHPTTGLMTNPMTTLGDVLYGGASGTPTRLAGDTSNSNRFLRSVSAGGVAAAPTWAALTGADIASGTIPSAVLGNSSVFIGTTSIALNRGTGALTLAGITLTDGVLTNIVASTGTAADLWSEVTTGSITIGTGLTSGALNLATGGTSATPIGIGHTNATLTMTGASLTTTIPLISLAGVADTATAATHYFVETATDGYIRPKTLANVKTEIVTTAAVNAAAATTVGTVTSGTWNGGVVAGQYGGTGVANTGKTLTISGNTSIGSSTHTVTLATSGNTSVTLPTSGTLEVTGHTHSYQPLDTDLTNIAALTGTSGFLKTNGANTWSVDTTVYGTDSLVVHLAGSETITGTKTFNAAQGIGATPAGSGTMYTALGARRLVLGDSDTGIGQISDGALAMFSNDVERFKIDGPNTYLTSDLTTFQSSASYSPQILLNHSNTDTTGPYVIMRKDPARNIATNDTIGTLLWQAPNTSNAVQSVAMITGVASGDANASSTPTRLDFSITPPGGAYPETRLALDSSGLKVYAADATDEGGEIGLLGAGTHGNVSIDNYAGHFRIITAGNERVRVESDGDILIRKGLYATDFILSTTVDDLARNQHVSFAPNFDVWNAATRWRSGTYETSADGSTGWAAGTWNWAAVDGNFTTTSMTLNNAVKGHRWTWSGISSSYIQYARVAFNYTDPVPLVTITVESSNNGSSWSQIAQRTGCDATMATHMLQFSTNYDNYMRVTVVITSGTNNAYVGQVELLTARMTGGYGAEKNLPISWSANRTVTLQPVADSVPLIAKGASGATSSLQEWRNSSNTLLANITSTGVANFSQDVRVSGAAATYRGFDLQTGGVDRWRILAENSSEAGSNTGSNFQLASYTDGGAYLDSPIVIYRDSGLMELGPSGVGRFTVWNGGTNQTRTDASNNPPKTYHYKNRSGGVITAGDYLSEWTGWAYSTTGYTPTSRILTYNNGTIGANAVPTTMTVGVQLTAASNALTDRLVLCADGSVDVAPYSYGKLYVGRWATADAAIEIGAERTVDGYSYIDFISATGGPDYNARITRNPGTNGAFSIQNTGTGPLEISQNNAGPIRFNVNGTNYLEIDTSGLFKWGTLTRQHLNLYGTDHGIGVQAATTYIRGTNIAFHSGGVHSDAQNDPGSGGSFLGVFSPNGLGVGTTPLSTGTMFTATGKRRIVIGDNDSGIGQVSDGVLAIYTNDVERLNINAFGVVTMGSSRGYVPGVTVGTSAPANPQTGDLFANTSSTAGAWTSYTPTLAQGASTNISKTVDYAKYIVFGKTVFVQVRVSATAAGTAGSAITITLPVTAASALDWQMYGVGGYYDQGSAFYPGFVSLNSTTKAQLFRADGNPLSAIGNSPNIAVAATDIWSGTFTYEAA